MGFAPSDAQIADFVSFTGAEQQDAVNYLTVSLSKVSLPQVASLTSFDSENQTLRKLSSITMILKSVEPQDYHLNIQRHGMRMRCMPGKSMDQSQDQGTVTRYIL